MTLIYSVKRGFNPLMSGAGVAGESTSWLSSRRRWTSFNPLMSGAGVAGESTSWLSSRRRWTSFNPLMSGAGVAGCNADGTVPDC